MNYLAQSLRGALFVPRQFIKALAMIGMRYALLLILEKIKFFMFSTLPTPSIFI